MSRINTNVTSLLAARILTANNAKLTTSLERLSTGLRINTGKDDPAGLIASEGMRADIKALDTAISNAERAEKMVATAEGALQEISAQLVTLEGLVDATANTAGLSSEEMAANQLQIDSILDTINRIAGSTEFAGKKLLDGSLAYTTSSMTTGASASAVTDLQINGARIPNNSTRTVVLQVTTAAQTAQLNYSAATTPAATTTIQVAGKYGAETLTFASNTTIANAATAINASKALTGVSAAVSGAVLKFNSTEWGSEAWVSVEAISGTFTVTGGTSSTRDTGVDAVVRINGALATSKGLDISLRSSTLNVDMTLARAFGTQTALTKTFGIKGGGAEFSIGPRLGLQAEVGIGIDNMSTTSLGKLSVGVLSTLATGGTNDLDSLNFETAQRIVRQAQSEVATVRGRLGGFQKDTLASTINSLQVALENVTAAESAIRDADFAAETANLTRAQILVQSSTSVLGMANQAPQSILMLLQ